MRLSSITTFTPCRVAALVCYRLQISAPCCAAFTKNFIACEWIFPVGYHSFPSLQSRQPCVPFEANGVISQYLENSATFSLPSVAKSPCVRQYKRYNLSVPQFFACMPHQIRRSAIFSVSRCSMATSAKLFITCAGSFTLNR